MGKRSAAGELFLGNMGSIQWETRPSMQREDQLTMETKLERIAAKCCESRVEERSAVNPHATFCGSGRRATASRDPVLGVKFPGPTRHSRRFSQASSMSGLPPDSGPASGFEVLRLWVEGVEKVCSLAPLTVEPARVINDRSGAREWSSIMAHGLATDCDSRAGRIRKCIASCWQR